MFSANQKITTIDILQQLMPVLRLIASPIPILMELISSWISCTLQPSDESRKMQAAQRTMAQIGKELLTNAKAGALASATENEGIEKNGLRGRDLLSLLVRANMATDNPESQRLSDKDVIARAFSLVRLELAAMLTDLFCFAEVPTFFVAGHETTR